MNAAVAVTRPRKHHFFGFHDLVAWNQAGDRVLALEVDEIHHPPFPGQPASVGYVDLETKLFIGLGTTAAWNFPQGARQQWLGKSDLFIVNARNRDHWAACVYDARANKLVEVLPGPVHTASADRVQGFFSDYSRLHRLGGYGYAGFSDHFADDPAPAASGVFRLDLRGGNPELLISLRDIAHHQASSKVEAGAHHYATHLLLNPAGSRLAFLHRYRLPDGGEMTRLMTIGTDGERMRCLARGFLSHFAWRGDEELVIWGRGNQSIAQFRESSLIKIPGVPPALRAAKGLLKKLLGRSSALSLAFLRVSDSDARTIRPMGLGTLTSDGHLMFCPVNRDWMINDTYPDEEGTRTLMLFQVSSGCRIDLGRYRMLDTRPDPSTLARATAGVDEGILRLHTTAQYGFTRSGLHCDLHPRWRGDGTQVAFDSIHEGTRQLYAYDVREIMEAAPTVEQGQM